VPCNSSARCGVEVVDERKPVPTAEQAGSESFGAFAVAALPALLRFGHVLTGNPQEAEDLVQEALAKTMRRWHRASPDDPVAYVRKVMLNTHLTRWRRWGARVQLGDVPEAAADDAELERSQDRDALRRAMAALPRRQRAVLVLRYLEDLPDHVIADLLGCQPATVRSLAARGLAALRPLLATGTTAAAAACALAGGESRGV
jgi:RNA polymerase sigma-70 factor (sigma-E family)